MKNIKRLPKLSLRNRQSLIGIYDDAASPEVLNLKIPIKRVGLVAMPIISTGGGFQRVARDLIAALNSKNIEVSLLTPFRVDLKKIAELYGPIKIDRFYYPNKITSNLCREDVLGRKLLKRQFRKMANEVDFIIDLDGGVLHRYLPKKFNKKNYIVWRLSCINPETHKVQKFTNWKILLKKFTRKLIFSEKDRPKGIRIYPLDEWTKREIIKFWKVKTQDMCLYPEIKVEEFHKKKDKKNQIIVYGRIAKNKAIEDSINIFADGNAEYPDYKLIIAGGLTADNITYLESLKNLTKSLNIEKKVEFFPNPSFDKIKEILSESKILLFSQIGVSLTMTAIEAMAARCIVISRKHGGTFEEILKKGKYGFGFTTIEDGGRVLKATLKRLENNRINNLPSLKRAEFFSSLNFVRRLNKVLKNER